MQNDIGKARARRCICCSKSMTLPSLCDECSLELFGHPSEQEKLFACAMVVRDGRKWYAFTVRGGGPFRFRELRLVACFEQENYAEIAARNSMRLTQVA